MALQRVLRISEAADVAGMDPAKIRAEINAGRIRAQRAASASGRVRYVIRADELTRYMRETQTTVVWPVRSKKQLLHAADVARHLGVSPAALELIRDDLAMRFPRPIQIDVFAMWTVEQVEGFMQSHAWRRRGKDEDDPEGTMLFRRAIETNEWALGVLQTPDASEKERAAASHCVQMFADLVKLREKNRSLVKEEERRRQHARAGFLKRAAEAPPESVPPILGEFTGRLVECPVPCAGQPVIYFLLLAGELVYIGQTMGVEMRLIQHVQAGKSFDRVLVMPVAWSALDDTERSLIERFQPRLNKTCLPSGARRVRAGRSE